MTDNKTCFGDTIVSDHTTSRVRVIMISPRQTPGHVCISINHLTGEYRMDMRIPPLGRHESRHFRNALDGIITWADNESFPARDEYNLRVARERMELEAQEAQS